MKRLDLARQVLRDTESRLGLEKSRVFRIFRRAAWGSGNTAGLTRNWFMPFSLLIFKRIAALSLELMISVGNMPLNRD